MFVCFSWILSCVHAFKIVAIIKCISTYNRYLCHSNILFAAFRAEGFLQPFEEVVDRLGTRNDIHRKRKSSTPFKI